jgi:protein tyrosine phosphatase
MLKSLWDTIDLVKCSFGNWNTTLWCDINVDQMELDCKKFVKASHFCMWTHAHRGHSLSVQHAWTGWGREGVFVPPRLFTGFMIELNEYTYVDHA